MKIKGLIEMLPQVRRELATMAQESKDYFARGAELVLADSGIDPMVMLGVFVWAYEDLLVQSQLAVIEAVTHTAESFTKVVLGDVPEKKDMN